jgi:hypothetical protein
MSDPKTGAGIYGLSQRHILDELCADPRYQKLMAQQGKMRIPKFLPGESPR